MPNTLRLRDGSYLRRLDVHNIVQSLYEMQCVQVAGFSNVGKSALLRLLAQPDVWIQELGEAGQEFLPAYIDCNRMLGMSDQGFYELVLRCLQESSESLAHLPELGAAYEMLVAPASEFQVPLAFNRGVTAALLASARRLIFLLDEFDEPFSQIDPRVFLNLRALRDRHGEKLAYVTATEQPLHSYHRDRGCDEFVELFALRSWYLAPLTRSDAERLVRRYMQAYEAPFTAADIDFIYQWTGGHPTLVEEVCAILHRTLEANPQPPAEATERWALYQQVARLLRGDEHLNQECRRLWDGCSPAEQTALLSLLTAEPAADQEVLDGLLRRHLLLKIEGRYRPFCRLLAEFLRRKLLPPRPANSLWVDLDSGDVLLNGEPVEALTNLEYRLIQLLFQNSDKIVDKYAIVTHVWGESYIDEVDDARIEKLISRLRQKIEPDPGQPRFLVTVRGRGYRLSLGEPANN